MTTLLNSIVGKRLAYGALPPLVVAVFAASTLTAAAQDPRPVRPSFEREAPKVGELMPDVIVYDRNGKEVRLRSLFGGQPAVLITGCLT